MSQPNVPVETNAIIINFMRTLRLSCVTHDYTLYSNMQHTQQNGHFMSTLTHLAAFEWSCVVFYLISCNKNFIQKPEPFEYEDSSLSFSDVSQSFFIQQ